MDDVQEGGGHPERTNGRPPRKLNNKRKVWRGDRCLEEGCDRDPVARDLCGKHYQQRQRDGLPMPPKVRVKMGGTQCIVESCIADAVAHGLCSRHAARSRRYGLVAEELFALDEHGECGGCGSKENLHVDHCHDSHKVRGLLCRPCNMVLGAVQDQPEVLVKLAAYLIRSREATKL